MTARESFEWGMDPDRTTGIVYAVRRLEIARFTDAEDAQDYCRWRNGQTAVKADDETPPHADIPSPEADAEPDLTVFKTFAGTVRPGPIVGELTVSEAIAARIWAHQAAPAGPLDPGDDVDAAIAALSDADLALDPAETEEITETASPPSALPAEPAPQEIADPTRGDPYHEAGEAFRRLKAGEKLGTVADDLGLNMPRLRSRWSNYQKGLQALAWQPGATVAKPVAPPSEADDGWAVCPRCRTKFNAAKAQQIAKLPQRPTHCAACR
jgi:hypothetical protein